jgi:hypothetical protein
VNIKFGPITDENLASALRHHGAEDIDIARMADELTQRRARDLTPAEVAVLRDAVWLLCSPWGRSGADEKSAATALSKLMGYGEGQP